MENPTKIYKVTLSVVDFDQIGVDGITTALENTKYPNWCISPSVISMEEREVDWHDNHPLNMTKTSRQAFQDLFKNND
jgi:hypothetical protein